LLSHQKSHGNARLRSAIEHRSGAAHTRAHTACGSQRRGNSDGGGGGRRRRRRGGGDGTTARGAAIKRHDIAAANNNGNGPSSTSMTAVCRCERFPAAPAINYERFCTAAGNEITATQKWRGDERGCTLPARTALALMATRAIARRQTPSSNATHTQGTLEIMSHHR
jgi:hypothetical protein